MERRVAIPNYNSEAGAAFIEIINLCLLREISEKSNPPPCTFEGLFRTGSALIYAKFPDPKEAKCGFVACKNGNFFALLWPPARRSGSTKQHKLCEQGKVIQKSVLNLLIKALLTIRKTRDTVSLKN